MPTTTCRSLINNAYLSRRRKETAGRADFDKEKDIEFNNVINFRESHSGLLGKNPITGLRLKRQCNSKAFHRYYILPHLDTECCKIDRTAHRYQKTAAPLFNEYWTLYRRNCWPGSSVGLATDYRLDGPGSNPGGDETGPGAHPASCTRSTGSFPGVEVDRAWGWPPPLSNAEVVERVELYLYSS